MHLTIILSSAEKCRSEGSPTGTTKRIRSVSSTCSDPKDDIHLPPPFQQLKHLNVHLNSPTHLAVFQYVLSFSKCISNLIFEQFFIDYEESLIISTLFNWNDLKTIKELKIVNGNKLSINALNEVIHNCPKLQTVGQISTWGKVNKHQLETIKKEIKTRNLDLVIDEDMK